MMQRGTLKERYDIYVSCADDGQGRDITNGCRTYIKTFEQWIDGQPGNPFPTEELTPEGVQYVLPGAERETKPSKEKEQGSLW